MTTIKEYAKEHDVSYEAVRKQVERYKKELDKHIIKKNRTQYLDDVAVNFLNERRAEKQIIIADTDTVELEELRIENERLKAEQDILKNQIIALQGELLKEKDSVKQLQIEKIELLETSKKERKGWFFKKGITSPFNP